MTVWRGTRDMQPADYFGPMGTDIQGKQVWIRLLAG